jgi:hypothetical protein
MAKPKKSDPAKGTKGRKPSAKSKEVMIMKTGSKKASIQNTEVEEKQLLVDNVMALSRATRLNGENLALLIENIENIANHIVAVEEIMAEMVMVTGIDIVRVNRRIRERIAAGTDRLGDPSKAIDVAGALVSAFSRPRF